LVQKSQVRSADLTFILLELMPLPLGGGRDSFTAQRDHATFHGSAYTGQDNRGSEAALVSSIVKVQTAEAIWTSRLRR
jgi:hypothetical protein